MSEKLTRRNLLKSIGTTGLIGVGYTGGVTAKKLSESVKVTDVGIIGEIDADLPHGYDLYTYSQDKLPSVPTLDGKIAITNNVPTKVSNKLRESEHIFRGENIDTSSINLNDWEYSYQPTRVSFKLDATTLVDIKDEIPSPRVKVTKRADSDKIDVSGTDIPNSESPITIEKHGAKTIPIGNHETKVKSTKLNGENDRQIKWVDCTFSRFVMIARRGEFSITSLNLL